MIIEGKAVIIPLDNVDTDVMYPGSQLNITEPARMKDHLFEGLDPSIRQLLGSETILFVGANFGAGSSREHAPLALKAAGVRAVVGRSFARIFFRNCINLGLPAFTAPQAVAVAENGSRVRIDAGAGTVEVDGRVFQISPLPDFILQILEAGGLVEWARRRLTAPNVPSWSPQ